MNSANTHSAYRSFLRLLSLSKSYRGTYALLIATSLLSTMLGLGVIEATRRIITGAAWQETSYIYSGLLIGLAAIVSQFTNQLVLAWLKVTVDGRSTLRMQLKLLESVTRQKQDSTAHHSSELYGRITDSVAEAQSGLNDKLVGMVTNIVQLGVSFTYFSWVNLPLTLGMIGFTMAYPLLTYPLTGRLGRQYNQRNEAVAHSDDFLQDAIQGGLNVRALSIRSLFSSKFKKKLELVHKQEVIIAGYDGIYDYANRVLLYGGMLFTLGFGGYQVLLGDLTIGGLTVFIAANSKLTRPLQSLAGMWNELIASISHTSRFVNFLDLPEEVTESSTHNVPNDQSGISLQVSQLSYAYKNGPVILKDLNLTINQGELTVILGKSGCGKSTLLKLLARLEEPVSGRISYNHSPLQHLTPDEWYEKIAFVPQEGRLFTGTIRDNIQYGKMNASQADIEQAARIAQIHDHIIQMSCSYETRIGETEGKLSGGEIQRVALARALVRNSELLLLDEPTSSLDPVTESDFMAELNQFRIGKAVVLITHKLSLAKQADQIIVMEDGMIKESGSHIQLMNLRGHYYTWITEKTEKEERLT